MGVYINGVSVVEMELKRVTKNKAKLIRWCISLAVGIAAIVITILVAT